MQKICTKKIRKNKPHTIGHMCKELQTICCDYDGGMAHSKHTICSYSNKDINFPNFEGN